MINQIEIQKEIVDKLVESDKLNSRLIIAPRYGKTKIMIDYITKVKPKSILWVTPFTNLFKQISDEFLLWGCDELKNTKITTWKSLNKVVGFFDLIVLDEEQYITEANSINFFNKKLKYNKIISLTGTESTKKVKNDLYDKLRLKILVKIGIEEAVEDNILSDYRLNIILLPNMKEHLKKYYYYDNIISKSVVGTAELIDSKLKIEGKLRIKIFNIEEKKEIYLIKFVSNTIGYITVKNNKLYGKFTSFGVNYDIIENIIYKPINKQIFINRFSALGNSKIKVEAIKKLLNIADSKSQRSIVFATTQKQARLFSEKIYHSKTDNTNLINFIENRINHIILVKAGSVGSTYKDVDNIFIVQGDSDSNGSTSQKITRALLKSKQIKNIFILSVKDTIDEKIIIKSLSRFSEEKIVYREINEIIKG